MRGWKQILLALLITSIVFFYPLLGPTPHRIDRAHADLIMERMTKDQVEAIFGVAAGQYDWAEEEEETYRHILILHSYSYIQRGRERPNDGRVISQSMQKIRKSPWTQLTWTSRKGSFT